MFAKNIGGAHMKNTFLSVFMLIASISVAQQAEKTLIKTFNANGTDQIVLDLTGDVNIQKWSNPTIRVQMNISYENASVHIMKYLITKGRYNLQSEESADGLRISIPEAGKDVVISKDGKILVETITYTVFTPENVAVVILDESQATVLSNDDAPISNE